MYSHIITRTDNTVVAIIDSYRQGMVDGIKISKPDVFKNSNFKFDVIVITSEISFSDIKALLEDKYGIDEEKIKHSTYFMAIEMLEEYAFNVSSTERKLLEFINQKEYLCDFNYDFVEEYKIQNIETYKNLNEDLYYVKHGNKPLYFKSGITEIEIKNMYRQLLIEQNERSPHRYISEHFEIQSGDIVLDAGVAEGNFSLEIIEKAQHVFLVEADAEWNEALNKTFAHYKDKITIINKYLSDNNAGDNITIDKICELYNVKFDAIKMDIEGYETDALKGAAKLLTSKNVKLAICAYQNFGDEEKIKEILDEYHYSYTTSKGYMVFMADEVYPKKFVRGLVYGRKREKKDCTVGNRKIWCCGFFRYRYFKVLFHTYYRYG